VPGNRQSVGPGGEFRRGRSGHSLILPSALASTDRFSIGRQMQPELRRCCAAWSLNLKAYGRAPWTPAFEAVTQLASTNMVTIRLLPFLAIPAQAGTHASTST
jgi:hypothetical protein